MTKPNDTAMFNLVRGVLKWAFLKTCVVNGTHATKTSTVLNALKKAIVASNPSIFTDDVARGLAEGPPAASHGGEASGVARAGSWNFEDVFQEAYTLVDSSAWKVRARNQGFSEQLLDVQALFGGRDHDADT